MNNIAKTFNKLYWNAAAAGKTFKEYLQDLPLKEEEKVALLEYQKSKNGQGIGRKNLIKGFIQVCLIGGSILSIIWFLIFLNDQYHTNIKDGAIFLASIFFGIIDGLFLSQKEFSVFLSLYLCGCLVSVGMLIGSGFFSVALEDIKDGYNLWGYIRTTIFQLFQLVLLLIFSWASVGYIYMKTKS
jgi:hypothetical protein